MDYSKENYVLYKADFPRKKSNQLPTEIADRNAELAAAYNPKGFFPLIVILNSEEQVLGTTGFKKITPNDYISLLNSFIKWENLSPCLLSSSLWQDLDKNAST